MNRDRGAFLLSHVYDDILCGYNCSVATPSLQFEKGNSRCGNVTNLKVNNLSCFSINCSYYALFLFS